MNREVKVTGVKPEKLSYPRKRGILANTNISGKIQTNMVNQQQPSVPISDQTLWFGDRMGYLSMVSGTNRLPPI